MGSHEKTKPSEEFKDQHVSLPGKFLFRFPNPGSHRQFPVIDAHIRLQPDVWAPAISGTRPPSNGGQNPLSSLCL